MIGNRWLYSSIYTIAKRRTSPNTGLCTWIFALIKNKRFIRAPIVLWGQWQRAQFGFGNRVELVVCSLPTRSKCREKSMQITHASSHLHSHVQGPTKCTTLFVVFSVIYYLELCCAISLYYGSHFLPTKVKLVVWTLYNINISTW